MTEQPAPITRVFAAGQRPTAKVRLDDGDWVAGEAFKLLIRDGKQWVQVMWRRRERDHGSLGLFPIERVSFDDELH